MTLNSLVAMGRMRWTKHDSMIVAFLLIVAGLLRFVRLGEPDEIVFDETYYAKDACLYAGGTAAECDLDAASEQSWVHPPAGKWLIAVGIRAFGYTPFGWRSAAALAGVLLVGATYVLTRRLFKDRVAGLLAGIFVATEFLLLVQSRISMLDIFLALFVVSGFMFLVFDRDRVIALKEWAASTDRGPRPKRELEWRFAAGACFGLAVATKWSAAPALIAAFFLGLAWTVGVHRRLEERGGRREILLSTIALGVVPALLYLTSYAIYFEDRLDNPCPYQRNSHCVKGIAGAGLSFVDLHDRMLDYHLTLKDDHVYQSKAWTWPLVLRPVAYYYPSGQAKSIHILAFGNVVLWYASLAAAVWLAVRSIRAWRAERVVAVAWAAQYLPWLIVARPLFFFYMTPIVPFMMIGLAGVLAAILDKGRIAKGFVALFLVVGVIAMTFYFYPVVGAVPIPHDKWRDRMIVNGWI